MKLDKIDFQEGAGVRKLELVGKPDLTGDQTGNFEKSEPFKFLAALNCQHLKWVETESVSFLLESNA